VSEARFRKLAVFGVGLIGGSFALALKRAGIVSDVVGIGRSHANLARAVELGVIDEISDDAAHALVGTDLVLIAVPVQQTARVLQQIAVHLEPGAVVTDGGSTKRDVVTAARAALREKLAQFVPAHPIAGAELSGVDAAKADLFRDRTVVITPLPETAPNARLRVEQAWLACGARLTTMDPERHDAVLAAVSHLPHALAFALVEMIAARADADDFFSFAGAGFRDFTRIASSSPEMWRDICLANRDLLLAEVNAYRTQLAVLEQHLQRGDGIALERMFEAARSARNAWISAGKR
jgi:prephenate dehydrogenase